MTAHDRASVFERFVLLPPALVTRALARPATRQVLVNNVGFLAAVPGHRLHRPAGARSAVVVICTEGTGQLRIDGATHRVSAGTGFVIPIGVPHTYWAGDPPWKQWWCTLVGTDVSDLITVLGVTPANPIFPVRNVDRLVALIDEIITSYERDLSPARILGASGAAWRLLTRMSVDRLLPERGDPLERAMEYLAERVDGEFRLPELAALVGISPSRLSARFRVATGGGVLAYHIGLRMAKARELLVSTGASIAEIAEKVGYHDPYYFSRHFRRIHGMSPTDFRRLERP